MDMKLEVVIVPVSDVDRAKRFYEQLGWRLDADFVNGDRRVVQFTPPGSDASIWLGKGLTPSPAGTLKGVLLVVFDVLAARADLVRRGVSVSEVFHTPAALAPPLPGPDPERKSYVSFATFSDPDGNSWVSQEIRERLPGRGSTPPQR
jgi:catechol 2,3-dioxygenase-like lactoylglutathione lyase family enzyme